MSFGDVPLWMRMPGDVTNEECALFHRLLSNDTESVGHFNVEYQLAFRVFGPRSC